MRVLFIQGNSNNIAGQELSLLERLKGLRDLGVQAEVLLPEKGIFSDLLARNDIPVGFVPLRRLCRRNPFLYFTTIAGVYRYIRERGFDLIHCVGAYPVQYSLPAARLNRIPCIAHINTTVYDREDLVKSFVPYVDLIMTISHAVKRDIEKKITVPARKICPVYNGMGQEKSAPIPQEEGIRLRRALGIPEDSKIIGQLSSVIPLKGVEYFIRMARLVKDAYPNVKFLVVGRSRDAQYQKALDDLVRTLGLSEDLLFTGFQERYEEYIEILDVSVLASKAEGLGRVIVESQKAGKPVVATDIEGIREVITHDKTGLLVPPQDPQALATAVLALLNDPLKAGTLAENGKQFALANFSIERHARAVLDVYNGLLGKNTSLKNVLFLEPSSGYGGSGVALHQLLRYLDRAQYKPFVVVWNDGPQFEKIKTLGIPIRRYIFADSRIEEKTKLIGYIKFAGKCLWEILPMALRLCNFIRKNRIQIAHINTNLISGMPLILAAQWTNIKCICHVRQTRGLIKMERLLARFVDKFIVLNAAVYADFLKCVPQKRLELIYDGIEIPGRLERQAPSIREEFHLGDAPLVGLVSRIVKGKGHEDFLRAASVVIQSKPDVRFLIVGCDPSQDQTLYRHLLQLTETLGLSNHVIFTGWRDDVPALMAELSLVVQASTYPEGLGTTTLEAMGLAKPVVGTKIAGTTDLIVHGRTGCLVEPGDFQSMAECIIQLLEDPVLCQKMGEEGYKRVQEMFDIRKTVKDIEAVYSSLLYGEVRNRSAEIPARIRRAVFRAAVSWMILWGALENTMKKKSSKPSRIKMGLLNIEFFHEEAGGFGGYGKTAKNITDYFNGKGHPMTVEIILTRANPKPGLRRIHNTDVLMAPDAESSDIASALRYARMLNRRNIDFLMSVEYCTDYQYSIFFLPTAPLLIWIHDPRPEESMREILTVSLEAKRSVEAKGDAQRHEQNIRNSIKRVVQMSKLMNRKIAFGVTAHCLSDLARKVYDFEHIKPVFLPTPVDVPDLERISFSAKPSVLFLGRLDPIKRPWIFFELAKRFPEVDFYAAGTTHFSDEMMPIIDKYRNTPNLKILGHVDGLRKDELLKSIWAIVNTSVHEALPVSFLESLSYGKQIISCQNPDDMVSRFGGYVGKVLGDGFDAAAVDGFAGVLEELVAQSQDKRREIGEKARAFITANYSYKKFEQSLNAIVQELVS